MNRNVNHAWKWVAASLLLVAGCAGAGRADVDRSQPDKLDKGLLVNADGTRKIFYYRNTITEVPPTNGWAFEGMQSPMDKIYFQITEDQLIGYRSYDYAPGSENPFTGGTNNTDSPVVSFKIKSHFDVKREYNPGTGEQTNVISENTTDRPWNERQYIRVDWTTDKLANPFMDVTLMLPTTGSTAISETDITNPNHAIYTKDYIDATVQVQAVPDYNACIKLFAFSDDVGPWNCGAANLKVRQSLVAVQPTEYEPLDYPDRDPLLDANGKPISFFWTADGAKPCDSTNLENGGGSYSGADCTVAGADKFAKFGFFRTVRQTYDSKLGATDASRKYLANRWNIWEKTIQRGADGQPIVDPTTGVVSRMPDEVRTTRQIPYYTNVEFPDDDPMLWDTAKSVVSDWNDAMKRTVAGVRATASTNVVPEADLIAAAAAVPDIFVLKRNSCNVDNVTAYVAAHADVARKVEAATTLDTSKIDKTNLVPTCSALESLTLGLADTDPAKFAWQRNGDLRYSFIYWVDRPQGSMSAPLGFGPSSTDPETGEIVNAEAYLYGASLNTYTQASVDAIDLTNDKLSINDLLSGKRISDIVRETAKDRQARDAIVLTPEARSMARTLAAAGTGLPGSMAGKDFKSAVLPRLAKIDSAAQDLKLNKLRGTALEAQLMNQDILAAFVPNYVPGITKLADISPEALAKASPATWMSPSRRQTSRDRMQKLAINGCLLTAEFADEAILGTALKLGDLSGQALYNAVRAAIFRGLTDHEMGHTMGLRHNFAGSTDALNYGKEYWTTRSTVPAAQWAAKNLDEHMYSTVMDYGARFNTDVNGLGRYDYAAIRFGYGKLMDVMPSAQDAGGQLSYDIFTGDYTKIPQLVGGVDLVDDTAVMRYSVAEAALRTGYQNLATNGGSFGIYPERPYKFCSDEFEGNLDCKTWDRGANQQEIINNTIDLYKNYYVFNAFQRGRAGWSIDAYMSRLSDRYFNRYREAFQFYYFYGNYFDGTDLADDLLKASMLSLNALGEVLQTPEPGPHCATDESPNLLTLASGVGDQTCHNDAPKPDIGIPDGKPYYLTFSDDYYYRITSAGSLYEKLQALLAITDTASGFFRIDQQAVQDLYSIGYYRVFKDQMLNLLSGVIRSDPSTYGGYAPNGVYTPTPVVDPATFGKVTYPTPAYMLPTAKRVDTPNTKTIEYYALLFSMAQLDSTWDQALDFSNFMNVTLKGSSDDATYAAGTTVVEFTHPMSHLVYRAALLDPARPGIGVSLLQDLNVMLGVAGTPGSLPTKYGMISGAPLPDWYTAKADLDAAKALGNQQAYSRALNIFTFVDSLMGQRVDLVGDIRTFRHAFAN